MKKIVASVGLVALGTAGLHAAEPGLTAQPEKPWNVSATLRGFYDDNINTVPSGSPFKEDTFGFEISPSALLKWSLEQTLLSAGYVYSFRYYDIVPFGNTEKYDQTHTFNLVLDHRFSERYKVNVRDSFVIGQEPDLLRTGYTFDTFQRVSGDNIRNFGSINFDASLTPQFGVQVSYANSLYDYDATGAQIQAGAGAFDQVSPSLGGLLNRMEHDVHLDGRYQIQPQTVGIVGYRFREFNYTQDELIGGFVANANNVVLPLGTVVDPVTSENRNSRQHAGYVGLEHNFRPDLALSLRGGANYVDYYNNERSSSEVSPYGVVSLKYTYALESYVDVGFSYDRSATDILGFNGISFAQDVQSAVVYGSVNHRITPKLYGSVTGQFQNSTFNGGTFNDETEQYYLAGLNLEYRFTHNFSGHVGYNYDRLDSDTGRSFDRNRVYIGVTASY